MRSSTCASRITWISGTAASGAASSKRGSSRMATSSSAPHHGCAPPPRPERAPPRRLVRRAASVGSWFAVHMDQNEKLALGGIKLLAAIDGKCAARPLEGGDVLCALELAFLQRARATLGPRAGPRRCVGHGVA